MPWFAHAARQISVIEIGRNWFMLELVLVTSDCGNTAKCSLNKSVKTTAAHICAFCETTSLCKNAKYAAYGIFRGTNSHNRRADQPEVGYFLKEFLPTPTTLHQTPSDHPDLVAVAVLVQNI